MFLENIKLAGALSVALALVVPVAAQSQAGPDGDEAPPAPPAPAPPAAAQANSALMITATKREQALKDVAMRVVVTTGTAIAQAQVQDLADLAGISPGLRVAQADTATAVNISIRGFGGGADLAGVEPSVGVFVDGVYRSRVEEAISDLPDADHIEVLEGPQSTLFGKNASAGAISITTQAPKFTFGGSVEGTYENYDGTILKGSVTGPLSRTLAFSLSAGYDHRRGYNDNAGTGDDINNHNRWFTRGQLLWTPDAQFRLRLIADYDGFHELCCGAVSLRTSAATQIIENLGGQAGNPATPFSNIVYANSNPTNNIKNYGFSGQVDYNLGPFKLTSITAWRQNRAKTNQDADFTTADIIGNDANQLDQNSFTQELRIASNLPGPVNILLGGFYYDQHLNQANQLSWGSQARDYANGLIGEETQLWLGTPYTLSQIENEMSVLAGRDLSGSLFGQGQYQNMAARLHDQSFSIFAQVDYKPTRKLTLTGGINYTYDIKHYAINTSSTDVLSGLDLPAGGGALPWLALMPLQPFPVFPSVSAAPDGAGPGRISAGDVTWAARATYAMATHVTAYGNIATGFKPGSVNLSQNSPPPWAAITSSPYDGRVAGPEHTILLEGGVKADWGKASLNFAVFKQIVKGWQYEVFTGTGFLLANAGQESNWGIEAQGAMRVTRALTLSGAIDWYHPRYDSAATSSTAYLTGARPGQIPPVTMDLAAVEDHPLNNGDHVILRGGWHYESRYQLVTSLGLGGPAVAINDAAGVALARQFTATQSEFDTSLTYAWHSGVMLSVWARNLTNDRYLVTLFNAPVQPGAILAYTNQPRTYGITGRLAW